MVSKAQAPQLNEISQCAKGKKREEKRKKRMVVIGEIIRRKGWLKEISSTSF